MSRNVVTRNKQENILNLCGPSEGNNVSFGNIATSIRIPEEKKKGPSSSGPKHHYLGALSWLQTWEEQEQGNL